MCRRVLVCIEGEGRVEYDGAIYSVEKRRRISLACGGRSVCISSARCSELVGNCITAWITTPEQQRGGWKGGNSNWDPKNSEAANIVKKLIVFDLDGTLAESKSSLDAEMSRLLHDLLGIVKVAVISGGDWPQFEKQLLSNLPHDERLANLSLLPTCGTKFFRYDTADWKKIYSEDFTADEKEKIVSSLKKAIEVSGLQGRKGLGRAN